ncbi:MAG: hypothetical protein NVS3B5_01420 [Sphingomicrobium sp.]
MNMALRRAVWHQNYILPVLEPIPPATLHAQWERDRDGILRCHWDLVPSSNLIAGPFRMDPSSLELVR